MTLLAALLITVDAEWGRALILQNDHRYGLQGTLFRADQMGQTRNLVPADRLSVEMSWDDRHTVIGLYAPFDLTTTATLSQPIVFRETSFDTNQAVTFRYLFDGYRTSYLYRLWQSDALSVSLGGSLQIRNAQVAATAADGSRYAVESDIGLVPALKARLTGDWGHTYATFDADGLWSPVGAILDTAITLGWPIHEQASAYVRLRYLGGGANLTTRPLYNWAQWLGPAVGIRWQLP